MFNRKIALVTVLLSVCSAAPLWALGEPAGEVIDLIEIEQVAPVKSDTVGKNRRIADTRNAAARKQAQDKAAAEKKESERLAAQKSENDRLAAQKAEEEQKLRQAEAASVAEKKENDRLAAQKAIDELKVAVEKAAANKQEMERLAAQMAADEQKMAAERAAAVTIENERLAALAQVDELRRAEEKAVDEKSEQERVAVLRAAEEKAAAEKLVLDRLAAQKAEEERAAAATASAESKRTVAARQEQERQTAETAKTQPGATLPRETLKTDTVASLQPQTEKSAVSAAPPSLQPDKSGKKSSGSWWSAFSSKVGLTDSDPGTIAQPVADKGSLQVTDYLIGPGDVIVVSVWRDENLTRTVTVLPDGKISLPLVGELVAEGKTVAMLKQETEKALSRYTAETSVSVEVKQSNSMFVFVTGRVNSPGRQVLVTNTNVLQALSMAGGPNPFAQNSKIKIFRQYAGTTVMYPFNYNEVMEGRHLETNIELKRGDVIIVP